MENITENITDKHITTADNTFRILGVVGNLLFKFFIVIMLNQIIPDNDAWYIIVMNFIVFFGIFWSLIAELTTMVDINHKANEQQEEKEWIQNKIKDVVDNKQLTRKDKIVRLTMLVHEERNKE